MYRYNEGYESDFEYEHKEILNCDKVSDIQCAIGNAILNTLEDFCISADDSIVDDAIELIMRKLGESGKVMFEYEDDFGRTRITDEF